MRLGLDIGTNSIGWWLYHTEDNRITEVLDGGVRIFSNGRDPKSGASLAVDRRMARSARRRRDRYCRRRTSLMHKLSDAGLMPDNPIKAKTLERLDPYELRARGLDEALPLTHLGRAFFHLNQRRGFKSNRKTDRGDNQGGKIKDAIVRLDMEMMMRHARTYGEFLHMRRSDKPEKPAHEQKTRKDQIRLDDRRTKSVRTRLYAVRGDNEDEDIEESGYDFYPDRRHLEDEFNTLWAAQVKHHQSTKQDQAKINTKEWVRHHDDASIKLAEVEYEPHPDILTDELRTLLFETIFHQRPLKQPEVGLCLFPASMMFHPMNDAFPKHTH